MSVRCDAGRVTRCAGARRDVLGDTAREARDEARHLKKRAFSREFQANLVTFAL
jgi:hypothetical protein